MQNLKKFREKILKLLIGNGEHGRTDGQTDGRTDTEGYNIIPRHTLVAGYKNVNKIEGAHPQYVNNHYAKLE